MTNTLVPTTKFKKHYKKAKLNNRWQSIFNKSSHYEGTELSSWDFVIHCLIEGLEIPKYFYPHPLVPSVQLKRQINTAVGTEHVKVKVLDLHFDGHGGDHLLVYCPIDSAKTVVLIDIGTHSELFI